MMRHYWFYASEIRVSAPFERNALELELNMVDHEILVRATIKKQVAKGKASCHSSCYLSALVKSLQ